MKAVEANLLKFLQQPKQFMIPIYQRTYSWEEPQCKQLWYDIMRVGSNPSATGHFIGSVVYIAKGIYVATSVPQLLVIDGQQRLTTLTLLIAALAQELTKREIDLEITSKKLANYYLFNNEEEGDLRYKLLLTRSDKKTLKCLVDGQEPPAEGASPRVIANFQFFKESIEKLKDSDLKKLYEGIVKLIIVDISLDRDNDNPQLIFESLNATALKLTGSDLIRNYILMGLDTTEQAALYENHWYPIEQGFANSSWFDWFIRDYLTIKTRAIPNISDIYPTFKAFVTSPKNHQSIPEIVAEMHRYAGYYVRFIHDKDPEPSLRAAFRDLRTLEVNVARPFLLRLYEDYDNGVLDKVGMLKVLRLIESYVFRRAICGIPTNTLNKTFSTLDREIEKEDYLNSVCAALLLKDSYRRFPTDEEFKQGLRVKDIYNMRTRNYLLAKLENHETREPIAVENYTIEHILPQNPNLKPEWREALGENWKEIHPRVLHTLGNLTLTGYNSEYSDRPFHEKRDMEKGFKHSPLRLNAGLGQLDQWNEAAIAKRAETLAEKALQVWECPVLSATVLAQYKPPTLDDTESAALAPFAKALHGDTLKLFNQLRKRIENLDASVQMRPQKQFIGFAISTNFISIIPFQGGMRVLFNVQPGEIDDPKGLCTDISGTTHWGKGNLELSPALYNADALDDVMELVRQAFECHTDEESSDTLDDLTDEPVND